MYERRHEPLLSRWVFAWRLVRHIAVAMGILAVCLVIGTLGYHHFEGMTWLNAFGNASMILSGMGPLDHPLTRAGMLFASFYALFSGVIFLTTFGIILAPIFHRAIHKFHRDSPTPEKPSRK
ncbi:MAG TPA: hypothetical protein VK737_05375 [Opitutales bacterium]|jgi:hypothetical protein|nr:hypothetical protein [Opitutales bacterium]